MGGNVTFETLIIIVFANVAATFALWRTVTRKPRKLKKKFTTALLHSKPIEPKHQPPRAAGDPIFSSLARDEDHCFFADFKEFANIVNSWLGEALGGSPWRLQELPDTEKKLNYMDEPTFGRRYDIFYNQVALGTLEVSPGYPYSAEEPNVYTDIELDWVRLLPFKTIHDFLVGVALHVCRPERNSTNYLEARADIDRAMTKVLWENNRISEFDFGQDYGELRLRLAGSAVWYLKRRQAPRNQRAAE
jgi:hypothetical protein